MRQSLKHLNRAAPAFTLIELLIVATIIAILAGILFPAFAQAKMAAIKAASLSNVKQLGLASIMYSNDFDDGLPLFANGNSQELWSPSSKVATWVWQTQPYTKSLPIYIDPLMGDPHGIFHNGEEASFADQNLYPDYGLNYTFLAPWLKDADGKCTGSGSVTSSGGSHPSTTLFFTTTYYPNEDEYGSPTGGYSDYGSWIVTAPAVLSLLESSDKQCVMPGMDWSEHPVGFNGGKPFLAEASARYNDGTVNAMLDGHAKYLTSDQQAAGTDWATSAYGHTKIVSASKYLWDYDGTFFGASVPE